MAVGSLGVPIWVSHVKDGQSLVVHNVSGSGANLKRLDVSARKVAEGDKAPTSVPEIIIISPFINLHHGVEVPACNRGQSIRVATSLPCEPKTDHLVLAILLDTPTPRQKPYAIAHSIQ